MAAPNIVDVSTITGKTTGGALDTTLTTVLLANAAASGKVFKINFRNNSTNRTVLIFTGNSKLSVSFSNQKTMPDLFNTCFR